MFREKPRKKYNKMFTLGGEFGISFIYNNKECVYVCIQIMKTYLLMFIAYMYIYSHICKCILKSSATAYQISIKDSLR